MALQVPDLDSLLNIELPEEYQENPKNLNYNASTSDLKWGKGFIQTNKSKKRKNNTFESNQRFFDYCDVCDKGFKTIMQKQNHFSQHVKCKEEGCNFEAHKNIVDEHWKHYHAPGSMKFRNIKNIDDYIKERKKCYPTKQKIEEKIKLQKEKRNKGIALKRKRPNRRNKHNKKENNKKPFVVMEEPDKKVYSGNSNPMDLVISGSTDTAIIENTAKKSSEGTAVLKVKNCSALASLMATYSCSDEDSEVDMQTDVAVNKEKITVAVTPKEKKAPVEPQLQEKVNKKQKKRKQKQNRNSKVNNQEVAFINSPSLTQKLLASEILKEKNDILQCVRFIIKNNFFE